MVGYNITKGGSGGGAEGEQNGMYGKTGELNPFYGRHHTEESKEKAREKRKLLSQETCPYCRKTMNRINAYQYHFENCLKNPNISKEAMEVHRNRKTSLDAAKARQVECPYCHKIGATMNMVRYHFEYCEQAPVLSQSAINRIKARQETIIRAKEKAKLSNKGVQHFKCPHCGFESTSSSNMAKHHFDKCRLNPNYNPEIFTCIHCGTESTNKTNIIRFHNDNCKHKPTTK